MSLQARREYLVVMRRRYVSASGKAERARILTEVVEACGYHRKYAIRVLRTPVQSGRPAIRRRPKQYKKALPAIQLAWTALDYPCAERLHPVLLPTVEQLARHGEVALDPTICEQLAQISRATLARRLREMPTPKARRMAGSPRPGSALRSEVPLGRYAWDESRPGALAVDLVEHNGGASLGHFAYTLTMVDVVVGWSRRRAMMGRGQAGVHDAIRLLLDEWPYSAWGLHSDNGGEFLNNHLLRFIRARGLTMTRSRPYKKSDNPHVEQKNRQFVRDVVGYARYDTPGHVVWLNTVYALLDPYANLLLPSRKVVSPRPAMAAGCGSAMILLARRFSVSAMLGPSLRASRRR